MNIPQRTNETPQPKPEPDLQPVSQRDLLSALKGLIELHKPITSEQSRSGEATYLAAIRQHRLDAAADLVKRGEAFLRDVDGMARGVEPVGATTPNAGLIALEAQAPAADLVESFSVPVSAHTISPEMPSSLMASSLFEAGFEEERVHPDALRKALLDAHAGADIRSLSESDWVSVLEDAENLVEDWQQEWAETGGVPEDSPRIEWNGFNRPSDY